MRSSEDRLWRSIVRATVESALDPQLHNVRVVIDGQQAIVEFDGDPEFRPGRFGTFFRVPTSPVDPAWEDYGGCFDGDKQQWASLAVAVQVEERYVAIEDEKIPGPDERGVRWLPEL